MKLRCITNSIRIRLRKSDISKLKTTGELIDQIEFPNSRSFSYGIILIDNETTVSYEGDTMIIALNKSLCEKWMSNQEVSLEERIELSNSNTLHILIEKDFPCKHTGNDFEDTYHELQPVEHRMSKN